MALPNPPTVTSPTASSSLDPGLCNEYISTRKLLSHLISLSSSPSTPLYSVQTHASLSREKPSIVLHGGANKKSGPVIGVVKIHPPHGRHFTIGIGYPGALIDEGGVRAERMVWEDLHRVKKWTYRLYQFEFGGEGQREVYTWRRTDEGWSKRMKSMELRVGKDGDEGDLVAVWRGSKGVKVKSGSMFVKRRGEFQEDGKWDLMVLLTGLSIIESFVRRS